MTVKPYEVELDLGKGRKQKTVLKLNDDDAKRLGVYQEPKKADTKKAAAPANKSRTAKNK